MNILGFDTTAGTVTAALIADGRPADVFSLRATTSHSTTLLPAIEEMLKRAGFAARELDLIVCSAGPGSFTGVRIGTSTAKGLAAPSGIPCVGVSSLEAMAYLFGDVECVVCPALGARRGNVYSALFASDGKGNIERLTPDELVPIAEIGAFAGKTNKKIIVTGDSTDEVVSSLTEAGLLAEAAVEAKNGPSGYGAALAGEHVYLTSSDKTKFTAKNLVPIYLRKSQAERELDKTGYKA